MSRVLDRPDVLTEHATYASTETEWSCSWEGCERVATSAVWFHDQPGHVHDCARHTAALREWTNVERVEPMPCRLLHGTAWRDQPAELR